MKRIRWIRTHVLPHRKTVFIKTFCQVLYTPLIKTSLLFHNILTRVNTGKDPLERPPRRAFYQSSYVPQEDYWTQTNKQLTNYNILKDDN